VRRRLTRVAVLATALVALVAPAAAQADPGVTVVIGPKATLQSRVLLTVPITVACDPLGDYFVMSYVSVEQASGTQIARGSGDIATVTCDSAPHTYSVSVLADSAGPPFHGGQAVVFASVNIFGSLGGEGGSAGPQSVSVRGQGS
jgi:uncharacterized protein (DUF2141 family)